MTIAQILEKIPDEKVRREAIENSLSSNPEMQGMGEFEDKLGLLDSLKLAFWWAKSPQGWEYWSKVYQQLQKPNK